jgi:hypothetical protein
MYPNVQLFCLKVLGASGQGTMGTVVTALNWVVENGRENNIRVVNLSLSGEPNDEVCEAISAVVKQGITVVAAAGNNGKAMENFAPGNCRDALVVTAMTDFDGREGGRRGFDANSGEVDDTAASFSNYAGKGRPSNMVAAPGMFLQLKQLLLAQQLNGSVSIHTISHTACAHLSPGNVGRSCLEVALSARLHARLSLAAGSEPQCCNHPQCIAWYGGSLATCAKRLLTGWCLSPFLLLLLLLLLQVPAS